MNAVIRFARPFLLLSLMVAFVGCDDGRRKLVKVKGRILVDDKPAPDAFVYFHMTDDPDPRRVRPYGQADEQGLFNVSTYVQGDGAPTGEYVLTFEWKERSGLLKNNFEGRDRLNGKYAKLEDSKQKLSVSGSEPKDLGDLKLTTK